MKNKPIDVYSAKGEFMFRDFNYNLAEFFHVSTDRINVIARKSGKIADGCTLKKAVFAPVNILGGKTDVA